jgi:Fe2+ transport system protein B
MSASPIENAISESSNDQETIMADHTREEIDAKIAAVEARTDTKIARLEGKLDLVLSKLESVGEKITSSEDHRREDGRSIRANQWAIGVGLAVLMVALVALFPVFFGIGTQLRDMVDRAVETAVTGPKTK